ncbi:hypothetical protein SERLA73DRAFT_190101 [Serpula lacrymans var. lacrymans S7.3]|uniref:Uncharacterized protein n=2 Tax=Serpula lacrymans var. lacrymans TaxID=341189 RepID=F8QF24_SERL3|nr:uncharacterized protein SERLADRAFT_455727 [Serpula lacrymans var. lacrymans S7.9]EGN93187.1 hypothetical protein SERLA73DRAFT_190101 [Serpula lacrymans var. lacrymans S7.3]EGO31086.1 hypothetical protein SERLADRAFT_455727 [Serpula lacrymans var. lacrymans S7.9]
MTWRRNFDCEVYVEELKAEVDIEDGVGERRYWSENDAEVEELGKLEETERKEGEGCIAGRGVDTPSAFASFARRCGGKGDRGGAHPGRGLLAGLAEY